MSHADRVWEGSCHCGAVRFRILSDLSDIYRCDCSLCRMKNALMTSVREGDFTLLAGADSLSEYNWNTGIARHFFCSKCGIYPFHRKRAMPDHYGVNLNCLAGFDPAGRAVRQAEGKGMSIAPEGARDHWPGPRTA
ncbi:MAG TPA: GFA family protein [Hyphomonas sp.]|nr:aldehyde-activating protein [Hyphomonas sp.]HRJ02109.1 GFA family protein [Hyphomonas sp.]